jgi:hypothetical protein
MPYRPTAVFFLGTHQARDWYPKVSSRFDRAIAHDVSRRLGRKKKMTVRPRPAAMVRNQNIQDHPAVKLTDPPRIGPSLCAIVILGKYQRRLPKFRSQTVGDQRKGDGTGECASLRWRANIGDNSLPDRSQPVDISSKSVTQFHPRKIA